MSDATYLKAIEDAFMSYVAGEMAADQFVRAVESALRAWRAG